MKKIILQLINVLLPAAVFYGAYSLFGIVPAILPAVAFSAANIIFNYIRTKKLSNTHLFGLVGLILSLVGVLFTDNEKLYYIPALVSNFIFLIFAVVMAVKRKSILHYIIRDFDLKLSDQIPESSLLTVNIICIAFFALKILSKLIGILFLDFETLYWLVFILGDPMTVVVVFLTIYFIRRGYEKNSKLTDAAEKGLE